MPVVAVAAGMILSALAVPCWLLAAGRHQNRPR